MWKKPAGTAQDRLEVAQRDIYHAQVTFAIPLEARLSADRVPPNRRFSRGSIVESTRWMVLHRPVELARPTRHLNVITFVGDAMSAQLTTPRDCWTEYLDAFSKLFQFG